VRDWELVRGKLGMGTIGEVSVLGRNLSPGLGVS